MYTIGQVAAMFQLPISTLRYYDKEGLFPYLKRKAGIRWFSEQELEALRVIECLKKAGLEIRDIKQFMQWCTQGASTYPQRYELFVRQRDAVEAEIRHLAAHAGHDSLQMLVLRKRHGGRQRGMGENSYARGDAAGDPRGL